MALPVLEEGACASHQPAPRLELLRARGFAMHQKRLGTGEFHELEEEPSNGIRTRRS